ncbi:MAG: hypothetical protein U9R34_01375 [Nanoarchaeota archaeon]|nr:hypothetical protein [Nanoarchaeota archaeon]
MATEALEQMLGTELVPTTGQTRMYETIDTYAEGTTALYTPPPRPMGPIGGPMNNMQGPGNVMSNQYGLDQDWAMQERFDFSGHNGLGPHLNYEIVNPLGSVQKNLNGYLGENDNHSIDLFNK